MTTTMLFTHPTCARFRGKSYTYKDMIEKLRHLNGGLNLIFVLGILISLAGLIEMIYFTGPILFCFGIILCIYAIYEKLRLDRDVEWSRDNSPRVCEICEEV